MRLGIELKNEKSVYPFVTTTSASQGSGVFFSLPIPLGLWAIVLLTMQTG